MATKASTWHAKLLPKLNDSAPQHIYRRRSLIDREELYIELWTGLLKTGYAEEAASGGQHGQVCVITDDIMPVYSKLKDSQIKMPGPSGG